MRPSPIAGNYEHVRSLIQFGDSGEVKFLLFIGAAVVSYLFPTKALQDTALAATVLVVVDTVTGLIAAGVTGTARTSNRFARVLAKSFAYLSVCAVASIVEKTILSGTGVTVTLGVLWLIIATEGLSILENVEKIGGGKFSVLRRILSDAVEGKDTKVPPKE